MSTTITIKSDDLQGVIRDVEKLRGAVAGDDVREVMGFAIQEVVQRHFSVLASDAQHHQSALSLGADRTGFYEEARAGTHDPKIEGGGVSVSIEKAGIAQRYFGGTIAATPGSYLTIPALAIAYGKRAREFDLRLVIFGATGLAALVGKGGPEDESNVYYWLVRTVTQAADPTVLPTEEEMTETARDRAADYIEQVWGKN